MQLQRQCKKHFLKYKHDENIERDLGRTSSQVPFSVLYPFLLDSSSFFSILVSKAAFLSSPFICSDHSNLLPWSAKPGSSRYIKALSILFLARSSSFCGPEGGIPTMFGEQASVQKHHRRVQRTSTLNSPKNRTTKVIKDSITRLFCRH